MLPGIIHRLVALFMWTSLVYTIGVTEFFPAATNLNNRAVSILRHLWLRRGRLLHKLLQPLACWKHLLDQPRVDPERLCRDPRLLLDATAWT
jgi:hypothetical protein